MIGCATLIEGKCKGWRDPHQLSRIKIIHYISRVDLDWPLAMMLLSLMVGRGNFKVIMGSVSLLSSEHVRYKQVKTYLKKKTEAILLTHTLTVLNTRDILLTLSSTTFIVMHPLVAILEVHSSWQQWLRTADHISKLKTCSSKPQ